MASLILRVDWLAGSFPAEQLSAVRAGLESWLGEAEDQPHGLMTYQRMCRFECGAFLAWSPERAEAAVALPGGACSMFSAEQLRDVMGWLVQHGVRCTRLDLACDDPESAYFDLDEIERAWRAEQVARFKVCKLDREERRGEVTGHAITFGRRGKLGGGLQVQFYNKHLESKGLIPGIRMEARFYKAHADNLFVALSGSSTFAHYLTVVRAALGGCIDFVEASLSSDRHLSRRARLPWWSRVVEMLGTARIAVVRSKSRLERAFRHALHQYGSTFGLVMRCLERGGYDSTAFLLDTFKRFRNAATHRRPGAAFDLAQFVGGTCCT